jgi:maleylacetate reductase
MSSNPDSLRPGVFAIQAQERIVHGQPAGAAVRAEAERLGAQRVFVVSTRSLAALPDGPLQRVVAALGDRHARHLLGRAGAQSA